MPKEFLLECESCMGSVKNTNLIAQNVRPEPPTVMLMTQLHETGSAPNKPSDPTRSNSLGGK